MIKPLLLLVTCLAFFSCKENSPEEKKQVTTYPIGVVSTSMGNMYFWLYNETPNHKAKFIELAQAKHYNQFTFNRVVKNFVIQGGCPDSVQYFRDSPYLLDPEFNDSIKHVYGALGMGRDDNPKKQSNACQIYIVNSEAGIARLDGDYMIFGIILQGKDVLEEIEKVATDSGDKPLVDIPMEVSIKHFSAQELKDSFGFIL
jgi:peptidyl-prolyl cis-trans isomerase B (cyclophilin B)